VTFKSLISEVGLKRDLISGSLRSNIRRKREMVGTCPQCTLRPRVPETFKEELRIYSGSLS
jgi:hypothetical protein